MKTTINELAKLLGDLDYVDARGFVKVMEKAGYAREVEKQKSASGKGKPTTVYEIDQKIFDLVTVNKGSVTSKEPELVEDLTGAVV
jgi:hypothetical protein